MGRIIGALCCLICAGMVQLAAYCGKISGDPIGFWTGDTSLKGRVVHVEAYNREMYRLYTRGALAFAVSGVLMALHPLAGTAGMVFCCTGGIYLVWRKYKQILQKYEA